MYKNNNLGNLTICLVPIYRKHKIILDPSQTLLLL